MKIYAASHEETIHTTVDTQILNLLYRCTVDEAAMFMSVGKTSEVYPPLSSSSIFSFPPSFITTFYILYAPPAASSWFPEAVDRPLPQIPNFLRVKSLQPLLCPLPGTHV